MGGGGGGREGERKGGREGDEEGHLWKRRYTDTRPPGCGEATCRLHGLGLQQLWFTCMHACVREEGREGGREGG